jgi:phage shock protein C
MPVERDYRDRDYLPRDDRYRDSRDREYRPRDERELDSRDRHYRDGDYRDRDYRDREYRSRSEQPPSRTRFYRDKRNGKIWGVCSGIADYTGFDVNLVRICMVAAVFLSSGSILPFYAIAAMVTPDKPRELAVADSEEQAFWQGVRASPARTARDIRGRFKDIDRRLADIESYVTTENRSLAREIEALQFDKGGNA